MDSDSDSTVLRESALYAIWESEVDELSDCEDDIDEGTHEKVADVVYHQQLEMEVKAKHEITSSIALQEGEITSKREEGEIFAKPELETENVDPFHVYDIDLHEEIEGKQQYVVAGIDLYKKKQVIQAKHEITSSMDLEEGEIISEDEEPEPETVNPVKHVDAASIYHEKVDMHEEIGRKKRKASEIVEDEDVDAVSIHHEEDLREKIGRKTQKFVSGNVYHKNSPQEDRSWNENSKRPRSPCTRTRDIVQILCYRLKEPNRDMIEAAVKVVGIHVLMKELVKEVEAIESNGGRMNSNGTRRRTPGDVLLDVIKSRSPKDFEAIFEELRYRNRKNKRQSVLQEEEPRVRNDRKRKREENDKRIHHGHGLHPVKKLGADYRRKIPQQKIGDGSVDYMRSMPAETARGGTADKPGQQPGLDYRRNIPPQRMKYSAVDYRRSIPAETTNRGPAYYRSSYRSSLPAEQSKGGAGHYGRSLPINTVAGCTPEYRRSLPVNTVKGCTTGYYRKN